MNTKLRGSPLEAVRVKLVRAEKHLNEVTVATLGYAQGECSIALEPDSERKMFVQRVRLSPSASPEISAIAGDFLANMKSILDYIVWELVKATPGNLPTASNQFPISDTASDFAGQVARKRLRGVPNEAAALIERLQPYNAGRSILGTLNRLHNIDKHRTLNVVTVVADNTEVISQSGDFSLFLGDEELRDGTIFGGIGMPFALAAKIPHFQDTLPFMRMHGKCSMFVAFDDESAEDLEGLRVDRTLKQIFEFIRDTVIPDFEPFFDSSPNAI
jgi:hypothetical protein